MTPFDKFFANAYEIVDTIKSSENSYIAVIYDKHAGHLCVMKRRELRSWDLYKLLKTCDNPHLPQIYRLFEQNGALIVIEEHIDGQTLEDLLVYQPAVFDEAFVLDILDQLCDCLIALHKNNIIHRDIKPSNIILSKNHVVKLIDFGIARIFKPDSAADTEFLGTRGYAAPEQFGLFDLGQTDARTDIHALAVTIKQLLGADYHGRILPVLDRCTSLNPDDRYQSVADLVRAIKRTQKVWYIKRFTFIAAATLTAFVLFQSIDIENLLDNPAVEDDIEPLVIETNEIPADTSIETPRGTAPSTLDDDVTDQLIDFIKNQSVAPPPVIIDETPPIIENIPVPPNKTAERPEMLLFINGNLSENRSPHSTAGDIFLTDADGYKNWRRDAKGNILFPSDWTATLRIQNHTDRNLINPRLTIDFGDDSITIDHADINAGQTVDIDIPIANKPALNVLGDDNFHGSIVVTLTADGEDLPLLIRDVDVLP